MLENVEGGAKALGQAGLEARVREHKTHDLGQRTADQFEIALEFQIVGEVKLADTCGVAAAAQVFE
jgi:hypothetical protein